MEPFRGLNIKQVLLKKLLGRRPGKIWPMATCSSGNGAAAADMDGGSHTANILRVHLLSVSHYDIYHAAVHTGTVLLALPCLLIVFDLQSW